MESTCCVKVVCKRTLARSLLRLILPEPILTFHESSSPEPHHNATKSSELPYSAPINNIVLNLHPRRTYALMVNLYDKAMIYTHLRDGTSGRCR
ncbi:hypothetical protein Bca4012_064408 [Brassica carinata]